MRMARRVSMPLMPGSMMSRMTRSMFSSSSSTESASSPLAAMTTSKCSRISTASRTSRRTSSSSTMSIRIGVLDNIMPRAHARQRNRELGPFAHFTDDGDFAVGRVQDAARDGQSQSRAALTAPGGDERLEDALQQVGRNALAVILDADAHAIPALPRVDPDVPVVVYGITSIEKDVGQNLLEVVKVPAHLQLGEDAEVHLDVARLEELFEECERAEDELRHVDGFAHTRTRGD